MNIREKLSRAAERIKEIQTKIILSITYYTAVAITHYYLKATNKFLHERTGFWQERVRDSKELKDYKKQF